MPKSNYLNMSLIQKSTRFDKIGKKQSKQKFIHSMKCIKSILIILALDTPRESRAERGGQGQTEKKREK